MRCILSTESPPPRRTRGTVAVDVAGRLAAWEIAAEVPVQKSVNGQPFTVMLATPANVEELACGLLITEQVVSEAAAIEYIDVAMWLNEFQVSVQVSEIALNKQRLGARTVLGNSGCGLCGVESLAHLHGRTATRPSDRLEIADKAIRMAMEALPEHQPLNALTRSVHAAAWCDLQGSILDVREDVGRHNALDKLVGALARSGRLWDPGFVVMSSRCSYELVYKTSATNAQLLATISSPTTMALSWSTSLGLPLASVLRRGRKCDIVRFRPSLSGTFSE